MQEPKVQTQMAYLQTIKFTGKVSTDQTGRFPVTSDKRLRDGSGWRSVSGGLYVLSVLSVFSEVTFAGTQGPNPNGVPADDKVHRKSQY